MRQLALVLITALCTVEFTSATRKCFGENAKTKCVATATDCVGGVAVTGLCGSSSADLCCVPGTSGMSACPDWYVDHVDDSLLIINVFLAFRFVHCLRREMH